MGQKENILILKMLLAEISENRADVPVQPGDNTVLDIGSVMTSSNSQAVCQTPMVPTK